MTTRRTLCFAALGACALLLAACGGGRDDEVATDRVPEAALASPAQFTHFAATLPEQDGREPIALDGVLPPTSETAEPSPISR